MVACRSVCAARGELQGGFPHKHYIPVTLMGRAPPPWASPPYNNGNPEIWFWVQKYGVFPGLLLPPPPGKLPDELSKEMNEAIFYSEFPTGRSGLMEGPLRLPCSESAPPLAHPPGSLALTTPPSPATAPPPRRLAAAPSCFHNSRAPRPMARRPTLNLVRVSRRSRRRPHPPFDSTTADPAQSGGESIIRVVCTALRRPLAGRCHGDAVGKAFWT